MTSVSQVEHSLKHMLEERANVLVSGRLSVDTYTDKQNQKQTGVEIVALDVRFLDQKPKTDTETQAKEPSSETATDGQAVKTGLEAVLEKGRGVRAFPLLTVVFLLALTKSSYSPSKLTGLASSEGVYQIGSRKSCRGAISAIFSGRQ